MSEGSYREALLVVLSLVGGGLGGYCLGVHVMLRAHRDCEAIWKKSHEEVAAIYEKTLRRIYEGSAK